MMVILTLLFATPALANRDIVFSMQKYRWNGPTDEKYMEGGKSKPYLVDLGTTQIYTVDSKGGRPRQITHGKQNSYDPKWSPDGKWILFSICGVEYREEYRVRPSLWVVKPDGSGLRRLCGLPDEYYASYEYSWCPNNREISLLRKNGEESDWIRIQWPSGVMKRVPSIWDVSWSPSGNRAYLHKGWDVLWSPSGNSKDHRKVPRAAVLDMKTGRLSAVAVPLRSPYWLSDQSLIGNAFEGGVGRREIVFLNNQGKVVRVVKAHLNPKMTDDEARFIFNFYQYSVGTVLRNSVWVVSSKAPSSDGDYWAVSMYHLKSMRFRLLRFGMPCGIEEKSGRIAYTNVKWVGKHTGWGRQCGALKILDMTTGRSKRLTPELVTINGGDWRKPRDAK